MLTKTGLRPDFGFASAGSCFAFPHREGGAADLAIVFYTSLVQQLR